MRISEIPTWDEKNKKSFLKECDIVTLHNWGSTSEVIAIAVVSYDTQYHQWNMDAIAGNSVDDRYDLFRTSPKKIGEVVNGENVYIGKWKKISENFDLFLEKEHLQGELDCANHMLKCKSDKRFWSSVKRKAEKGLEKLQ